MSGKKIFFNISVRFQRSYVIALFACIAAVTLYLLLYLIIPYQSFFSGIIMAVVISLIIGFGLGHLVIAFNREMKKQVEINKANDEVKAQLIYVLSHDIKGPLYNINHLLKLAQKENISPEELQKLCNQLQEDTESTLLLTKNLVRWIQTKKDHYEPSFDTYSVSEMIKETTDLYSSTATGKNIEMSLSTDKAINIQTDAEMYKIVIRNLISNAIKFAPENSKVEIGYKTKGQNLITWVEDNGAGIEKEELTHIFSENAVIDSKPGTKDEIGTGIGLQLSKSIASKLNGELWAESETEKGTRFYFSLPIKTSH